MAVIAIILTFVHSKMFTLHAFREWEKEIHNAKQHGKDPSFLWAIIRAFGCGYSLLGLLAFLHVSLNV